MNLMQEQVIVLEADHRNLCKVQVSSKGFREICTFLRVNVESAQSRISMDTPECLYIVSNVTRG